METFIIYLLIASVLTQSYYILFIFSRLASFNHSSTQALNHSTTQAVSVIVCAHNELSNLKELLPKLLKQDHQNYEMIIVDDRSDDGTFDYVKNLAAPPNPKPLFNPPESEKRGIGETEKRGRQVTDSPIRPFTISGWNERGRSRGGLLKI
ncbi:MAG: glycosyltransferase, partial [Bacteroidetes bacterium]|nr:glycosyltransferase [Bacteroidota bacterium]